ncbi:MAG: transcription-repair coupling factor [Candidatus Eisenbacteria bacterium]|nr:transcription-repair coupling factor [Candidatus Eisenbacteria bacterium]
MPRADARVGLSVADSILERFAAWPAFAKVLADLRGGAKRARIGGLVASTRSLALAALARERAAPIVLITAEAHDADEIREDIDFLLGPRSAVLFPDLGEDPYGAAPARSPARSVRAEILSALALGSPASLPMLRDLRVIVTTPPAWMRKVPEPAWLRDRIRTLRVGESADPDILVRHLVDVGYELSPMVGEYGDASRRGGILDIYTLGREHPVRCEFDGDEIVSLREFDVFTQRSLGTQQEVVILPTAALQPSAAEREEAGRVLEERGGVEEALVDLVRGEGMFDGSEWLAGFYPIPLVQPGAYLPSPAWIVLEEPARLRSISEAIIEAAANAYETAVEGGRVVSPPDRLFAVLADLAGATRCDAGESRDRSIEAPDDSTPVRIEFSQSASDAGEEDAHRMHTRPAERFGRNLELTRSYILRLRETCPRIHILCDTEPHRERLSELLHPVPAEFHVGNLAGGFEIPDIGLAVLTDHEIFARTRRRSAGRRFSRGISVKELLAMSQGDFVVHIDHGIGVYRGLSRLLVDGQETDCMTLEYAGGDKLYIPVEQLSVVQRYSAEEGHRPQLSRLGTPTWARKKAQIKRRIRDMAEELLRTYAIRRSRPGHSFAPDSDAQAALELAFPYEETPDQLKAISEVKTDMESPAPMDRLVCGDVGYGKTEVALRAAFKAVIDGKQVAVLVPTTLLAEQHFDTFSERLREFPVRVEMLSRFRSAKEQKAVIEELRKGRVDILIGTHRLIQKDVVFRELGLLIIDEEHRFGVVHKERLKKLTETVDCLTLTATPIPRTLHLALSGGRDMSTIMTPPVDRRPIQTEIVEFRDDLIAHALMREADRGGQSFFVHNRIESIDAIAGYLAGLAPHLRFAIAHGQMREQHLERVMRDFLAKEYDVLISTAIIESGLDFPNVNTILVNRGDTFGLAQLYQLRGRVGRSSRKAYAFLLTPPYRSITEQAQKRLKAIEEFGDLGSGFQLAMRDLEIRGAGNLLGAEQHGFILNVGFDLYCRLLDETVRELKGIPLEAPREARIVTDLEAYLPDGFVPDVREKMNLYKSLADTNEIEGVAAIEEEVRDRFGSLPDPGRHLFDLRRVRLLAGQAGVETATIRRRLIMLEFREPLTRGDIKRIAEAPVPVEFRTPARGRHRITCQQIDPDLGPIHSALAILRSLLETEIAMPGTVRGGPGATDGQETPQEER